MKQQRTQQQRKSTHKVQREYEQNEKKSRNSKVKWRQFETSREASTAPTQHMKHASPDNMTVCMHGMVRLLRSWLPRTFTRLRLAFEKPTPESTNFHRARDEPGDEAHRRHKCESKSKSKCKCKCKFKCKSVLKKTAALTDNDNEAKLTSTSRSQ